ncbi:O-antigen ligase family protein [Shewanella halotolerans]|uniref:O-antigen ligase family protein n=1 Tax=Shewanella halotolerans TaxID=2864204 RepID=UPI001C65C690|nr:O-antigen ligase family protein [Shewanella halotolerans]QYJ88698.1 O-antigen ligase family protein [Shewanella halotolerans]
MTVYKINLLLIVSVIISGISFLPSSIDHVIVVCVLLVFLIKNGLVVNKETFLVVVFLSLVLTVNTITSVTNASILNYFFNYYLYICPFLFYMVGLKLSKLKGIIFYESYINLVIIIGVLNVMFSFVFGLLFGAVAPDVNSDIAFLRVQTGIIGSIVPQISFTLFCFILSIYKMTVSGRFVYKLYAIILFLGLLTSYARLAILLSIFVWFIYIHKKNKSIAIILLVTLGFSISVSNSQLVTRFQAIAVDYSSSNLDSVGRGALALGAFKIARDSFPLGTGISSWGSPGAENAYSPYYFSYKVNHVYGLEPNAKELGRSFLIDSHVVQLIAELGFIGAFLFFIAIFRLSSRYNKIRELNWLDYSMVFFAFAQMLGTPFLYNPVSYFSFWIVVGMRKGLRDIN